MAQDRRRKELQLPVNRIKTIMKSSPNVETIGSDSLHMVTKCTELFVRYLTINGLRSCVTQEKLDYKGIATFVNETYKLGFLTEIMPYKMKVKDIRSMLLNERYNEKQDEDSDEDETDDDDDDDDEEEEENDDDENEGRGDEEDEEEGEEFEEEEYEEMEEDDDDRKSISLEDLQSRTSTSAAQH